MRGDGTVGEGGLNGGDVQVGLRLRTVRQSSLNFDAVEFGANAPVFEAREHRVRQVADAESGVVDVFGKGLHKGGHARGCGVWHAGEVDVYSTFDA